ncbi:hypothetical protein IW261DRAFT_1484869 [Armillaria novae-zelandiae]|uniref:Uncharacterized protein n=1 Tax=Armillaria novae-zelandiae TaxID=153914 RepID=A0AA39P5J5_9AGAR|nr:hypothetical protein IW261DRAFT_1484869 [Armillaria novae-zelandiae]
MSTCAGVENCTFLSHILRVRRSPRWYSNRRIRCDSLISIPCSDSTAKADDVFLGSFRGDLTKIPLDGWQQFLNQTLVMITVAGIIPKAGVHNCNRCLIPFHSLRCTPFPRSSTREGIGRGDNPNFNVCHRLRSERRILLDRREHWVSVINRDIKSRSQLEGWAPNTADVRIRGVGMSCTRRRWLGLVYSNVLDSFAKRVSVAKELGRLGRSCQEVILTCILPLIRYREPGIERGLQLDNGVCIFLSTVATVAIPRHYYPARGPMSSTRKNRPPPLIALQPAAVNTNVENPGDIGGIASPFPHSANGKRKLDHLDFYTG